MTQPQLYSRLKQLASVKEDLWETLELVEISKHLFSKKLSILQDELRKTEDLKKQERLIKDAEKLYEEYKKSLQVIETYMDLSFEGLSSTHEANND